MYRICDPVKFLTIFYYLIINRKLKKWGQERVFHDGKKIQNLTQGLHGIKTVKIFNQEQHFLNKFNYNLSLSAKANQYATLVSQLPPILIEFIAIVLIITFMIFNVQASSNISEYFPKLALFAAAASINDVKWLNKEIKHVNRWSKIFFKNFKN